MSGIRLAATAAFAALGAVTVASPALAAPTYELNKAGNGVTQLTGTCGGEPATLVTNNNRSSDKGGWGAAHVYGEHTTLIPTQFSFALVDLTHPATIFSDTQTKGSGNNAGTVVCHFEQTATDDEGNPLTVQDLIDFGEITEDDLPAGVELTDALGFVIDATVRVR